MTDQHTPGPWRWVPEPDTASPWRDYGDLYSASSEVVLSGWENDFEGGVRVNSHADARLIEAAPEMWDLIVELFEDPKLSLIIGGNPNRVSALMERADKLRAKVRGTQ
jgi:hypothetical protein